MLELWCTEHYPCWAPATPLLVTVPFTRMKAPRRNAHTVLLLSFRTQISSWFLVAPQEFFVYVFLFKRALSLEKGRGFKERGSWGWKDGIRTWRGWLKILPTILNQPRSETVLEPGRLASSLPINPSGQYCTTRISLLLSCGFVDKQWWTSQDAKKSVTMFDLTAPIYTQLAFLHGEVLFCLADCVLHLWHNFKLFLWIFPSV